ncbi:hypothetical protein EVA_01853 [gut metagenome]|uniref:Uncharacterized protein n=1 Tax=gut metagenome TaxID=749906 RepID=J9H776_9ZZZZ
MISASPTPARVLGVMMAIAGFMRWGLGREEVRKIRKSLVGDWSRRMCPIYY